MNVVVVGAGKMGLPLAVLLAHHGALVTACDINVSVVDAINAGTAPFEEPGLQEALSTQVAAGRLRATTATGDAIREADAVITIVPVKLTVDRRADLSIIESIARLMATCLRGGSLVSFETTLPVGTTRRLGELIAGSARVPGVDFHLVFSPERVKSRSVLSQLGRTPKVVGGLTQACAAAGDLFYKTYLGVPVHNVGTLEAAEYTKLAGMVYRDVNIALQTSWKGTPPRSASISARYAPPRIPTGKRISWSPGSGSGVTARRCIRTFFSAMPRCASFHCRWYARREMRTRLSQGAYSTGRGTFAGSASPSSASPFGRR